METKPSPIDILLCFSTEFEILIMWQTAVSNRPFYKIYKMKLTAFWYARGILNCFWDPLSSGNQTSLAWVSCDWTNCTQTYSLYRWTLKHESLSHFLLWRLTKIFIKNLSELELFLEDLNHLDSSFQSCKDIQRESCSFHMLPIGWLSLHKLKQGNSWTSKQMPEAW